MKKLWLTTLLLLANLATAQAQLTFKKGERPIYSIRVVSEAPTPSQSGILWDVTDSYITLILTRNFSKIKNLNAPPQDLPLMTVPVNLIGGIKLREYNYYKRWRSFFRATSIGLGLGLGVGLLKQTTPTYEVCRADIEMNYDPGDPYPIFSCQVKGNKPILYNSIFGFTTSTIVWVLRQKISPTLIQFKKKNRNDELNSLELRQYTVLKQVEEYNAEIIHYEKLPLDALVEALAANFIGDDALQIEPPALLLNGEKTDKAALAEIPLERISTITLLNEKEAKAQYSGQNYPSVVELTGIGAGEQAVKNIKVFRLKNGRLKMVKEIGL